MGGTSTDVSRYDGKYEHVFESATAGVCIQAPQVHFYATVFLVTLIRSAKCLWLTLVAHT